MAGQFIGRVRELQLADDALDRATAGHGSVLVLTGEAGIGKSRLAREIATRAQGRGMRTAWSAGWPGGGAPAYWPWSELLTAVDCPPALDLDGPTPPGAERFDRFRSIGLALRRRAADQPLVLVLDDVHTLDADGLLLTRFVARSVVGQPLLLVLTHRTAPDAAVYPSTLLDDIDRDGLVLRLAGLGPEEVGDLLTADGDEPEAPVIARVRELTNGNPYLVEQVLEAGLHHGDRPAPGAALRLLDAQLDALDAATRQVLAAAAVLGPAATSPEVAAVAAVEQVTVERARRAAAEAGLVRPDRAVPFAFSHDLAREVVVSNLPQARLAELHRCCLALLETDGHAPERALRRARHALALAHCSIDEAGGAIEIARSSAAILLETGAPEAAVELLHDALALEEVARGPSISLVTELGYGLLATGRLADARRLFRRAVATADASGDALTYAQAALGLGGVWVNEHRGPEENRGYHDILERAIRGLTDDASPDARRLAASLQFRRAAEVASLTGEDGDVYAALDAVRARGGPHELAAALSLLHHLMLGPQFEDRREAVARELLDVARSCGDELQTLMGLLWSATDALLAGHDADRALTELRDRAEALGMQAILFVADAIDVMRLMREGELVHAETAADECLERGIAVGDADAATYYGAHLLALRWYAGRAGELLDLAQDLAASTAVPAQNPVFTAVVAGIAAEGGDADRARRAIDQLGRGRLHDLLPTSSWLTTIFSLVEAAAALDDTELADELYDLLLPYSRLPVMSSIGVACFGSAERSLGLAARTSGRIDDAIAHLEQAVAENQRLGNQPMTAIARADLAETLVARNQSTDRDRAAELIVTAIDAAQRMDLDGRLRHWKHVRENIEACEPQPPRAHCRRRGSEWTLAGNGEQARVPHSVGMTYLAILLATPGTEVAAGELAGIDLVSRSQEVLDPEALRTLRRRITELEDQIDSATLAGRSDRARALQEELGQIVEHARTATGKGGRSRRFDDAAERARTSVQKAIRRAIAHVGRDAPRLGEALGASVRTGHRCSYEPQGGAPERWDVQAR